VILDKYEKTKMMRIVRVKPIITLLLRELSPLGASRKALIEATIEAVMKTPRGLVKGKAR
jgi:hypothetical protein